MAINTSPRTPVASDITLRSYMVQTEREGNGVFTAKAGALLEYTTGVGEIRDYSRPSAPSHVESDETVAAALIQAILDDAVDLEIQDAGSFSRVATLPDGRPAYDQYGRVLVTQGTRKPNLRVTRSDGTIALLTPEAAYLPQLVKLGKNPFARRFQVQAAQHAVQAAT